MSAALALGFSPCPNDTFAFYALVHGRLSGAPVVRAVLEDIETLNRLALRRELDVAKVSFHAYAGLRPHYFLLRSGGALGRGCGPLVVAREPLAPADLARLQVAIPGERTTAALLLRLFCPAVTAPRVMPFHRIMPAVAAGEVDAGVIIHESRFTYPQHGLVQVADLGAWWETTTGHPIPLGGIAARRSLGAGLVLRLERALRASVAYARAHPEETRPYVARHAQEMDEAVRRAHIELYVNDFTLDYGSAGEAAISHLLARAGDQGLAVGAEAPLFACEPA
ncbi:MAG: 1,4-dihydroxy-6-naphthoate synthase [Gemmatimonadota bacterium]